MTKTAKSNKKWARDLLDFAKSRKNNLGTGGDPPKNSNWKRECDNIKGCPKQQGNGAQSLDAFFTTAGSGGSDNGCRCGWHDGSNENIKKYIPQEAAQTRTPADENNPPKPMPKQNVPTFYPTKPHPRLSISEVANRTKTYYGKVVKEPNGVEHKLEFDLTMFGYMDGKCPQCGAIPSIKRDLNLSLKLIHTTSEPRFVQGIGMHCSDPTCGKSWQTFEYGYVVTLPKGRMKDLNAVIVGKSDGIDITLILMMRNNMSGIDVQRTVTARLEMWHDQLRYDFKHRCNTARDLKFDVVADDFPRLDKRWIAKQEMVIRAFIRNYIAVRPDLNREMASLKAEHSLALDHQAKVVKRAKGSDATQSCTIMSEAGFVLGYYCVPTDDYEWVHEAMVEIVERHGGKMDPNNTHRLLDQGSLPDVVFIDKGCCNGKEGGRNEESTSFPGLLPMQMYVKWS